MSNQRNGKENMDGSSNENVLPVRILLVDDEARNLEVLESILTSPDYELYRAQTAEGALLELVQKEFACIVLDIQMPEMNGIELARMIKTRKRSQHIPIIFLTAYFQDEKDVLQGYGVGAVDYLTKPLNPAVLKSKVGVFVDLFRATRALTAANAALKSEVRERQQLEALVLKISEREQQRIGQDLHDGLCQHLTGIKFRCRLLEEKLARRKVEEAMDAHEIEELLSVAVELARNQAHGLSPLHLEREGLVAAFHELAAGISRVFGVRCSCSSAARVLIPDHETAIHLYRIAQEAISNAIKHGKAKTVQLHLAESDDEIRLTVQDDGRGLRTNGEHHAGMGLAIMNYRARTIGAKLELEAREQGGTTVSCSLPRGLVPMAELA
jgi:signal transduction histidine kinase